MGHTLRLMEGIWNLRTRYSRGLEETWLYILLVSAIAKSSEKNVRHNFDEVVMRHGVTPEELDSLQLKA